MVARNFSVQDIPYSRLLQVPDEEREFLNLEELKPHQLTELGISNHHRNDESESNSGTHHLEFSPQSIYYDLNSHHTIELYPNDMTKVTHDGKLPNSSALIEKQKLHPQQQQQQLHQNVIIQRPPVSPTSVGVSRKRKSLCTTDGSDFDDETSDDAKSVRTTDNNKKHNHSEIEKRRRDKMNTYITELSSMVPMCNSMSHRKLDKLTVLRMAVQHLKSIRGAVHSYTEGHYKPAFLSEQELKMLILQAAEGFLFVVGCDRGRILYVSESVSQVLNYSQGDLLGQSWFDILHPKDVAKVKEQLSSSDLSPRERLIDAKTMLPLRTDEPLGLSRLCPGARRSFFCRMKCKTSTQVKEEAETSNGSHRRRKQISTDKKYTVIQCTGYLKSWAPAKIGLEEQETDGDNDTCNLSCLVAVGRIPPNIFTPKIPTTGNYPHLRTIQFISRHAMDGKFLFVDQSATLVLGFLPQELLGTSMYEYYQHDDVSHMADAHRKALLHGKITTPIYRFKTKDKGFVRLQSEWKSFKNPWTKDVEYLISKNSVILTEFQENYAKEDGQQMPANIDFFDNSSGREMHWIINSHVEASKIGRKIANQVIDYHRRFDNSSSEDSPLPSDEPQPSTSTHLLSSCENSGSGHEIPNTEYASTSHQQRANGTLPGYNHMRTSMIVTPDQDSDSEIIRMMGSSAIPEPAIPTTTSDGNDEAAMAVIMSLLEADAGLGDPVDFNGLPWPLP